MLDTKRLLDWWTSAKGCNCVRNFCAFGKFINAAWHMKDFVYMSCNLFVMCKHQDSADIFVSNTV